MRNSTFFSEAMIVANAALKHKDPIGKGVISGIKALRYRRDNEGFDQAVFDKYAAHYERIARVMVSEYLEHEKNSPYEGEE
jgi:hypothetical protein